MDDSLARIQSFLAKEVRGRIESPESAQYPDLSSSLERLLGWHWHSRGLSRSVWFDGLDEPTIRPHPPDRLELFGLMTWAEGGREQWSEIFYADIQLAPGASELSAYTLRFGRKGQEGRKIPYGKYAKLRTELNDIDRVEWAFVFTMVK